MRVLIPRFSAFFMFAVVGFLSACQHTTSSVSDTRDNTHQSSAATITEGRGEFHVGQLDAPSFAVAGIAVARSVVVRWSSQGQLQLDFADGSVQGLDSEVQAIDQVLVSPSYLAVRGSILDSTGESAAVAVLARNGTHIGTWTFPGLMRSIALSHEQIYASDHQGKVWRWRLIKDARPVEIQSSLQGDVHVSANADGRLVLCSLGSLHHQGDPSGACSIGDTRIDGQIWHSLPVLCGDTLIAETRAGAAYDAPTQLQSWDVTTGQRLASSAAVPGRSAYTCMSPSGFVTRSAGRGQLYVIDGLQAREQPLCQSASTIQAALHLRTALCLQANGSITIEVVPD